MLNTDAIDTFQKQVQSITDHDYGDFMRKSNMYFNRMLENFSDLNPKEKEILLKMKYAIQYTPKRDNDACIMEISKYIKQLKKLSA